MSIIQASIEEYDKLFAVGIVGKLQLDLLKFIFENQDKPEYGGAIYREDVHKHFNDKGEVYGHRLHKLVQKGLLFIATSKTKNRHTVKGWRTIQEFDINKIALRGKKVTLNEVHEKLVTDLAKLLEVSPGESNCHWYKRLTEVLDHAVESNPYNKKEKVQCK